MYEYEIINHQTTQKDLERVNDKLYLWLDHLENSAVDLGRRPNILLIISVMVKQHENGYKDTALEIAGKGIIIKLGYCMLLKSIYCFIFQFFFNVIPHTG